MTQIITRATLCQLVDRWIAAGKRVMGPRRVKTAGASANGDVVQYDWLASADSLLLEGFVHAANSIKECVLPRSEPLYGYTFDKKQPALVPVELSMVEQIVVGARPCDAAALPVLDRVFNWDYKDESYNRRRELTTVVTLACRQYDAHCFCTSLESGPADTRGSDVLLVELDGQRYEARCLTDKGRQLLAGATTESPEEGHGDCPNFRPTKMGLSPSMPEGNNENVPVPFAPIMAGPPPRFDLAAVGEFLAGGYERPEWQAMSLRCLGCGACAYTCPTCHCFDIVDERQGTSGLRVRNWDACQFRMFTVHASGHNPRSTQSQRQRQRIFHKFQTYPDKFGEVLCTGCGNCTRNCPVSLGVLGVLKSIAPVKENVGEH
jgi:ferredoxin